MTEKLHDEVSHATALRVGGVLGAAGASAAAYMIWHHYHGEAHDKVPVRRIDQIIFEEPQLPDEQRRLMARVAVCVYSATASSLAGVIQKSEITSLLGLHHRDAQHVLGHLRPKTQQLHDLEAAYVGRRPSSVDRRLGYFALPTLVELVEIGGSPTLDQAIVEMAEEHAGHDVIDGLHSLQRFSELSPVKSA